MISCYSSIGLSTLKSQLIITNQIYIPCSEYIISLKYLLVLTLSSRPTPPSVTYFTKYVVLLKSANIYAECRMPNTQLVESLQV